jgi:hypothetical protein
MPGEVNYQKIASFHAGTPQLLLLRGKNPTKILPFVHPFIPGPEIISYLFIPPSPYDLDLTEEEEEEEEEIMRAAGCVVEARNVSLLFLALQPLD